MPRDQGRGMLSSEAPGSSRPYFVTCLAKVKAALDDS